VRTSAIAVAGLAILGLWPGALAAQKAVTVGETVEVTATIEGIDKAGRIVTLKAADGTVSNVYAGPDVKRFDELKVGDKVTFRYYESVVFQIRKPGAAAAPGTPAAAGDTKLVRNEGGRPGGTISRQETATVTVKAIDAKVPSVTVTTADGNTVSFKVDNPKNLEGVSVGDKVDITYTAAVMVSVK
jgi:hypothetical protein